MAKDSQKQAHYPSVEPSPDFPKIEEAVLKRWKQSAAFKQSIENRADAEEFIFYDGPPFANGLPHYGHLLTGYVKDLYARYQTMRGKKVERRFGWDCHGLPAEMGSEKELGISGRAAIEAFGIDKFNEHCRTSVMKYTSEWEAYVTRQARWVDFKNDYKTMDIHFMESVLWAFKQLWDKGLVYEAHRVMPYSWAAETPLSNFETKLDNSYREREDKAITVAFELEEASKDKLLAKYATTKESVDTEISKIYILAWTTTPWTLPSNLALAAGKIDYVMARHENNLYILAKSALSKYSDFFSHKFTEEINSKLYYRDKMYILPIKGKDLIGLTYKPLFPYFESRMKGKIGDNPIIQAGDPIRGYPKAFTILDGSSFVTDTDGTGIVHIAPGFGEDDHRVATENGIPTVVPVDEKGRFTDAIFDLPDLKLKGLNVIVQTEGKTADEPFKDEQIKKFGLANLRIIKWLKDQGKLIKDEQFKHNYPHCWRTDTPLIYRAMPSWYVEVTKFRDRAVELNKEINWIPEHIRDGQMGHMLATAPDWSISRNRFWGTPIPVWRSESSESGVQSSEIKVFGSIKELEDFFDLEACFPNSELRTPNSITDLHRPYIDKLTIAKDGSKWQRVTDVFDCWFESGSMPFAQVHYPFENKEWFESHFPADFITEYVGQTRGWFNTLIMLSTALFDKAPFKNCICHGVVLDSETGLKYSKRLKNYKDPMEVMDKYGADALRWLMISSPVMRGQDLAVDPEGKFIRDVVRLAIKPIWNAYNFFTLYANADGVKAELLFQSSEFRVRSSEAIMDRYILAKCAEAVRKIEQALDAYDTPAACDAVMQFFEVLNNWYIRRTKERFWKEEKDEDKQAAYDTLYTVLTVMCRAAAPLLPLTLDEIYKGLTGEESVHLAEFPSLRAEGQELKDLYSGALIKTSKADAERKFDETWPTKYSLSFEVEKMEFVRNICNTALAIRSSNSIRVRQPLRRLTIFTETAIIDDRYFTNENERKYYREIIADEVNLKEVIFSKEVELHANKKLEINFKQAAKRLGEKIKPLITAAKSGNWRLLEVADNGFPGKVEVLDQILENTYSQTPDGEMQYEFWITLEPKPEYASRAQALSTNDALVILDTAITPELEAEGIARDAVRMIQEARKQAQLNVSDRIELVVESSEKIQKALEANRAYIEQQTLSTLEFSARRQYNHVVEQELEGVPVKIAFSVAA